MHFVNKLNQVLLSRLIHDCLHTRKEARVNISGIFARGGAGRSGSVNFSRARKVGPTRPTPRTRITTTKPPQPTVANKANPVNPVAPTNPVTSTKPVTPNTTQAASATTGTADAAAGLGITTPKSTWGERAKSFGSNVGNSLLGTGIFMGVNHFMQPSMDQPSMDQTFGADPSQGENLDPAVAAFLQKYPQFAAAIRQGGGANQNSQLQDIVNTPSQMRQHFSQMPAYANPSNSVYYPKGGSFGAEQIPEEQLRAAKELLLRDDMNAEMEKWQADQEKKGMERIKTDPNGQAVLSYAEATGQPVNTNSIKQISQQLAQQYQQATQTGEQRPFDQWISALTQPEQGNFAFDAGVGRRKMARIGGLPSDSAWFFQNK